MKCFEAPLPGVIVIEPAVHADERGQFMEIWNAERYGAAGLNQPFVQDNVSVSKRDVVRGLHFQWPQPQGKLVSAVSGEIFDVAVDVRVGSPTFGQWAAFALSATNGRQLYIPEGFAHGFATMSECAVVVYKCTAVYCRSTERVLRWDDPALGVDWPVREAILSARDAAAPHLADIPTSALPTFRA
ncbi:MAG: dTDP-4-dehydrorhamnose 3,5-epimerase [Gemmatimonadaceae bacterium]